jgi:hypothetical protein
MLRAKSQRYAEFEMSNHMTTPESSNPAPKSTRYYPWWLDNLAEDVTGEGAAMQGIVHGAENVHKIVTDARVVYQDQQVQFTGNYGDNGFLEEYTCKLHGEPTSVVVTVKPNAAGKAQHLVVNHRPRSSVLHFARTMGKMYAGTPLAKYLISD